MLGGHSEIITIILVAHDLQRVQEILPEKKTSEWTRVGGLSTHTLFPATHPSPTSHSHLAAHAPSAEYVPLTAHTHPATGCSYYFAALTLVPVLAHVAMHACQWKAP